MKDILDCSSIVVKRGLRHGVRRVWLLPKAGGVRAKLQCSGMWNGKKGAAVLNPV